MAQEKTILESIREYLTTCPVFSGSVIHKDYLLEEWLEKQSLDGSLPEMEGVTPVRIDTVKSGYLDSREAGYVKYLMECRMVYLDNR